MTTYTSFWKRQEFRRAHDLLCKECGSIDCYPFQCLRQERVDQERERIGRINWLPK